MTQRGRTRLRQLRNYRARAGLLLAFTAAAGPALAQTSAQPPEWQFDAVLYAYIPKLTGSATFPTGAGVDITVDPSQILHNLNFVFAGAFEVHYGDWGLYTDLLYVDASNSKSATHALSIGSITIPGNVTADASLDVKSALWTLGGTYRLISRPEATVDFLAGSRVLFLRQHLTWQFSGDVGPFVGTGRRGSGDADQNYWDGIVGVKGRWLFGDHQQWYVPYYLDLGTGQSEFTWQALAGIGYAFSWGGVTGVWRYVDYRFSSHSSSLTLNGPALGVAFRW
jgi:hypothetical protein